MAIIIWLFEKGNTDMLADSFIKGAVEAGHSVKKVFLGDKKINYCTECNACRTAGQCVVKDDMIDIYLDYSECDMIVLASPLYWFTISGMLKSFIDRLYGCGLTLKKDKECALLMTAAQTLPQYFSQATAYYQYLCQLHMKWKDRGMVLACNCGGVGDERKISETKHLEEGYQFGKSI